MSTARRAAIPLMVQQHQQSVAALYDQRAVLVTAPHARVHQLGRIDERIAAHLDGLSIAGDDGMRACMAALESPFPGEVFTVTVLALQGRDPNALDTLLSLVEAVPDALPGLIAAFGWVSAASLRGVTKALLDSPRPQRRAIGLLACAMHQVDPGAILEAVLDHPDPALRACALQVAGDLGRLDQLPRCQVALQDTDRACRFLAARSAALLGDRNTTPSALRALSGHTERPQLEALYFWLKIATSIDAHAELKRLSGAPESLRALIRGAGVSGDVQYVPWLLKQMSAAPLARLAGEAFSLITGLDLAELDLDRSAPDGIESGPNDDPNDTDVALDEDESLPWPDPEKLAAWWQLNGSRFSPGTRYFLGEPPSPAHALAVLKTGFQRQRIAAAEYLSLMQPGTPLFNTSAPAWRQQRLLAQMGG